MDPFTIASGAVSGITGILNTLFGGKENKKYTVSDLYNYGYKPFDASNEKIKLFRLADSMKKENKEAINENLISQGFSPATTLLQNEKGINDQVLSGSMSIDDKKREEDNKISMALFNLNNSQPDNTTTGIDRFFSGGLNTFNMLSNLKNSFKTNTGSPGNTQFSVEDLLNYLKNNTN